MLVSDVGRSIWEMLVFMKAAFPSVETLDGSLMLVTQEHPLNDCVPICIRCLHCVRSTSVRREQSKNA